MTFITIEKLLSALRKNGRKYTNSLSISTLLREEGTVYSRVLLSIILGVLNWNREAIFCSRLSDFSCWYIFQCRSKSSWVKASWGKSSLFSLGFCCCSHSFLRWILAIEREEICFPSLGCISIFGKDAGVGGRFSFVFSSFGLEVSFFSGVRVSALIAGLLSSTAEVFSNGVTV